MSLKKIVAWIVGVGVSPGSVLAIEVVIGIGQPRSAGVGVHSGKLRLVYIPNGKSFVECINNSNVPQPVEFGVTNVVSW